MCFTFDRQRRPHWRRTKKRWPTSVLWAILSAKQTTINFPLPSRHHLFSFLSSFVYNNTTTMTRIINGLYNRWQHHYGTRPVSADSTCLNSFIPLYFIVQFIAIGNFFHPTIICAYNCDWQQKEKEQNQV